MKNSHFDLDNVFHHSPKCYGGGFRACGIIYNKSKHSLYCAVVLFIS